MRHLRPLALLAFALLAPALRAADAAPLFTDDLDAARTKAKASHKDLLVDFTGSGWCGWCTKLDKDVFETPAFKAGAPGLFELVQLDFPADKAKQTAEVQARNKAWKAQLKSNSFPNVLLLDEDGKVYARTGYREGGPEAYLKNLESLRQRRIGRDEALAKADKAEGIEKAKHLDAALSALRSDEVLLDYYGETIKQILKLDSKDEAGLKTKYAALFKRKKCEHEITMLCQGTDGAAMLAKLKDYAARQDIPVESRQYALHMASGMACERVLHDFAQALELNKEAIALAPDSPLAEERLRDASLRLERRLAKPKDAGPKPRAGKTKTAQ